MCVVLSLRSGALSRPPHKTNPWSCFSDAHTGSGSRDTSPCGLGGGGGRAPSPSPRDGWPTRLRWSACALCAAEESVSAAGQGLDTGAPRWTHRGPGDRRLPDVGAPSAGNRAGAQGPLAWAAFQEPRRGLLCWAWTLFLGLRDLWQVFKCAAEPGSDDFPAGTLGATQ